VRASSFRVDSRVSGRVLAAALALTLTTAVLAGCGTEDKPKADPSPTSKPSVPPGLDTKPPSKPTAAETKESAVEYGRYFALLVQHAIRTRDIRPVMAQTRDPTKCSTCRDLSEHIEQNLLAEKLWEDTPDLRLGQFSARQADAGFVVTGPFEYPPGRVVTMDGTQRDVAPGGPFTFALYMVWDAEGSRWRVIDYTFMSKSKG